MSSTKKKITKSRRDVMHIFQFNKIKGVKEGSL